MYSVLEHCPPPPLLHDPGSSDVRDLAVRFEEGAWVVERVDRSSPAVPLPTREEAELYAFRAAMRLAPCWVRIYTADGDLRVAWHAR